MKKLACGKNSQLNILINNWNLLYILYKVQFSDVLERVLPQGCR